MKPATVGAVCVGVLLLLLTQCSFAPKAKRIEGDVARAVKQGIARGTESFDHSKFDAFLKRHVDIENFRFDYVGAKKQEAELDTYLAQLAAADLATISRDHLFALLVNAYNAYTVKSILGTITPDRPAGVASIRDISDVFSRKQHTVGGFRLSLDNIEHNILRPFFKDPRIHFAVNCASVSCPPLAKEAYTGERLEAQLEAAARRTLQHPNYIRVEDGRLRVTEVMDWYGSDFVNAEFHNSAGSLAEYIARYATDEVKAFIARHVGDPPIRFLDYDWSLNRTR